MDDSASTEELLASLLKSEQATSDIANVYRCLSKFPREDPTLASFRDVENVRKTVTVMHGQDNSVDYLVYNDDHKRAGHEVCFQVAGYIASFDVPRHGLWERCASLFR